MPEIPPLIDAAMKKAGVVWITGADDRPQPAWQHWSGSAAYLVTGPGEQPLPIEPGGRCTVRPRAASTGASIVTWVAEVGRVEPGTQEWDEVIPALVAGRLNAPDSATLARRWAEQNTLLRLVPTGALESVETPPKPPVPTTATTPFRKPPNLGARLRRKRGSRG